MKWYCNSAFWRFSDVTSSATPRGTITLFAVFPGDRFRVGLVHTLLFSFHVTARCRPTLNVFAAQKCLKARLCFHANRRRFSPRTAPERMVGSGIRWTSGPSLSGAGWLARLKGLHTSRLETLS